jgi:phosphatidate cytidylyltransferase
VLAKRLLTALALGVAVAAAIFVGPPLAPVLILGAMVLAGAWEWSGLAAGVQGGGRLVTAVRVAYLAVIAAAMFLAWSWSRDPVVLTLVWGVAGAWWLFALVWLVRRSLGPAGGASGAQGGDRPIGAPLVAAAGLLSMVPAWLALSLVHVRSPGPWPLVVVIGIVVAADMGAYFTGRLAGRRRLVPRVSPGKTWEGLGGGLLAAFAVAVAAVLLQLPLPSGLVPAALVTALISVLGDLTVSLFKRHAGVKHSGALLPGHGGMLDRIDSFCSAAPAFAVWLALSTDWL